MPCCAFGWSGDFSFHATKHILPHILSAEVLIMERKSHNKPRRDDLEDYLLPPGDYPDMTPTASATETTGLIPTPPQSNAQYRAYQTLHGMQIPAADKT